MEAPPAGTRAGDGKGGGHSNGQGTPGQIEAASDPARPGAASRQGASGPPSSPAASTRPTEEQHYLLVDQLWEREPSWRRKLTHGALVKLNREFGTVAVTELLRSMKTDLGEGRLDVGAPFPWMQSALVTRREVKAVAVHR